MSSVKNVKKPLIGRNYLLPFILITSLFFMWGFARSILDVLNKHFQDSLNVSVFKSAMVQGSTYVAYALMALPAGIFITRFGYRRGVIMGLSLFALGAFMFIPGEKASSFYIFLGALFVLGCGLAVLETAANPYSAELGAPETAASRLNLSQSFNGLGSMLGPVVVGGYLFSEAGDSSVAIPYTIMGALVVMVAIVFTRVKLPEIKGEDRVDDANDVPRGVGATIKRLWSIKEFRFGVFALFCYEIAEIAINSLFVNYAIDTGWLEKQEATRILSVCLLLFMIARVVGSAVMSRIRAEQVLTFCAAMTVICAGLVALNLGSVSRCAIYGCYIFEGIMFPTIFAITIGRTMGMTKIASSFLMMTPLGGAVGTLLMSWLAGRMSISASFIIPCIGYLAVLLYSINTLKVKK